MQSFLQSLCLAFDKGTEVPIFICVNCWREVHRRIFLDTPGYKQSLRCADARDGAYPGGGGGGGGARGPCRATVPPLCCVV